MYDIFSIPDFKFSKDFMWGTATAGHQIEGNNPNCNRYKEELDLPIGEGSVYARSGMACNHYNMVEEDTALLKEYEIPCYRMSIEWSRIEPSEGVFDDDAIRHYLDEISLLKEKGIKVFLTIHHFTHPIWFDDLGGFSNLDNRKYFERFLEKVVPLYAPYVDNWNVLNEFTVYADRMYTIRYHALGYHIIKKYSKAPVSTAHPFTMFHPKRMYDPFDNALAAMRDATENEFFFHAIRTGEVVSPLLEDGYIDKDIKDTCDYWAINAYHRAMVDSRAVKTPKKRYTHSYLPLIDMEFYLDEFYPEVMVHQLSRLKDKSVIITENGVACNDDDWRIVYLTLYLSALHDASEMGVDVSGYMHWSFMDNFEWRSYIPKFGLIDVNFETFERTPKNSAYFYRDIIRNNGFSQEILRKYLNKVPTLGK
ncbi:MAG: glycoside hydrolase family 1 protein [Clostridia bacterium]|nr:glycoside hydrolase family 1 protein [Clostridia bacterium]